MSPAEDQRFRRSRRLRNRRDFQRGSREGVRVATSAYLLLAASQHPSAAGAAPRLGVTVSRKVGIAVTRNRVKRRLREWFRTSFPDLPPGHDLIVIARPAAAGQTLAESGRDLDAGVERLARAVARRNTR